VPVAPVRFDLTPAIRDGFTQIHPHPFYRLNQSI
jgi:hypothetical protein